MCWGDPGTYWDILVYTGMYWDPRVSPPSQNPSAPERELVSFLVVRRRGSALTSPGDPVTSPPDPVTSPPDPMTSPPGGWARVTAPVRPRPRHVSLSLCCPDGAQRRLAVTAARHGR